MSLFEIKWIFGKAASIGKKVFLVIFVYAIIISLFAHFIGNDKKAFQTLKVNVAEQNRLKLYALVNDPKYQKTKEGKQAIAVYRGMICGLIGETCTNNPAEAKKYISKSLTGQITGLFMLPLQNPPASGVYWAQSRLEEAGFVPKTYAAEGLGFSSLRPIMNLWKVFRDLSYMLLVLVLVAIGFMIMFRMKINPQTVISVENALPKIVVAMILITFSFAIAGFLIDLMYVLIALIIALISNNGAFYDIGKMQSNYLGGNPNALWDSLFMQGANNHVDKDIFGMIKDPGGTLQDFNNGLTRFGSGFGLLNYLGYSLQQVITSALPPLISSIIYFILNTLTWPIILYIGDWIGNIFRNPGAGTINLGHLTDLITKPLTFGISSLLIGTIFTPILIPIIIGILVFFTILLLFFRIFFTLFKAYLQVIFWIIIAPFMLLFEAVPGKATFSTWFKHLAADIFTFPIVIAILTICFVLSKQILSNQSMWQPPFLNALEPSVLATLISMGVLFMTPDLLKLAKQSLFGVKDIPLSFSLGTFFAGTGAGLAGGMGLMGQVSSLNLGVQALSGKSLTGLMSKAEPKAKSLEEALGEYFPKLPKN